MNKELSELLIEGINLIDTQLKCESTVSVLEKLYDEITLFNPVYKLVSCSGKELVIKHILDSLAPVKLMKQYCMNVRTFADLGSGSGLPGIVLASAFENYEFYLVERMGRRAGFLRNTVTLTGLGNRVQVLQKDLCELNQTFDAVSFRAFRHMRDIASDLVKITHPGSVVFAYKSSEDDISNELETLSEICPGKFSHEIINYSVPFLEAKRNMLVLTRNIS